MIGDSQTEGYFGQVMHTYLSGSDNLINPNTRVYGVRSSAPRHWAQKFGPERDRLTHSQTARINEKTQTHLGIKTNNSIALFPFLENILKPKQKSVFEHLNSDKDDFVIFQFIK